MSARSRGRAAVGRRRRRATAGSHVLAAGETLRIVDLHGNQAVDTLFFDAHDYANRYSAVDTLREQGSAYLTLGSRLLALDGEPLVTIIDDTCGRHDTLGGACSQESNVVRYGEHTRHMHACRNTFLAQALAWGRGLDKRDLSAQRELLHERPADAGRRADVRGRHLRARQVRRAARRPRHARADLQLPAAQQPVQRLRPDAGAAARVGCDA